MKNFLVSRFKIRKTCFSCFLDLVCLFLIYLIFCCDQSLVNAFGIVDVLDPVFQVGFYFGLIAALFLDIAVCFFVFIYEGFVFIVHKIARKKSSDQEDTAE